MNTTYGTPAGGYGSPPADQIAAPARRKRWFRWGAGIVVAGLLAGGGIALASVSGSGGPAGAAGAAGAAGSAVGGGAGSGAGGAQASQQAAMLNSALGTAASDSSPAPRVRRALGRLRRLGGVHGEFTVRRQGGFRTLAFERGTIQSVSGSAVVIKAADGTTWTWQIVSDTVVRKAGSKTTKSALSAGQSVFAGGPEVSGSKDARLIVIRPAQPSSGQTSGSSSGQTSLS